MSAAMLDRKLAALEAAGMRPVTLDQFSAGFQAGSYVVTFDDGYLNVLRNATEVLARHQVVAIQFLVAGRLGHRNEWDISRGEVAEPLMSESEVREWLAAGHLIGSHGLTHRVLHKLSESEAREEIAGSKKRLEDRFGVAVRHFCYPSGYYSPRVVDWVRDAGYETACTVDFGVNPPSHPPHQLRRISPLFASELFAKVVHRLKRRLRIPA